MDELETARPRGRRAPVGRPTSRSSPWANRARQGDACRRRQSGQQAADLAAIADLPATMLCPPSIEAEIVANMTNKLVATPRT